MTALPAALLGLSLAAASASAFADYTIQIGAYAKPELADRTAAAEVAEVRSHRSSSGLTRILVGRYGSSAEAASALQRLRAAGYRDAFIKRLGTGRATSAPAPSTTENAERGAPTRQWEHLSPEQRAKLVLLDGRPHIKDGDTFTPLEKH